MSLVKYCISVLFLLLLCGTFVFAGDAVVVGYTADGTWTSVTYYRSSAPKGGRDYKPKAQARIAALRDLKRRGGAYTVRTRVLAESDRTGYAAVARGVTGDGKDINAVGYAESQRQADETALAQLNRSGANLKQHIVYRYFSYGDDTAAGRHPRNDGL